MGGGYRVSGHAGEGVHDMHWIMNGDMPHLFTACRQQEAPHAEAQAIADCRRRAAHVLHRIHKS